MNDDVLQWLALEMYTRGVSTRDIEEAFREVTGDMLLSRTAVSSLTDQPWEHQLIRLPWILACYCQPLAGRL